MRDDSTRPKRPQINVKDLVRPIRDLETLHKDLERLSLEYNTWAATHADNEAVRATAQILEAVWIAQLGPKEGLKWLKSTAANSRKYLTSTPPGVPFQLKSRKESVRALEAIVEMSKEQVETMRDALASTKPVENPTRVIACNFVRTVMYLPEIRQYVPAEVLGSGLGPPEEAVASVERELRGILTKTVRSVDPPRIVAALLRALGVKKQEADNIVK